jgi:hypothetical protein
LAALISGSRQQIGRLESHPQSHHIDCLQLGMEGQVDWIERLLGFSPDGGDGSVELIIVVVATLCAAAAVAATPQARRAFGTLVARLRSGQTR